MHSFCYYLIYCISHLSPSLKKRWCGRETVQNSKQRSQFHALLVFLWQVKTKLQTGTNQNFGALEIRIQISICADLFASVPSVFLALELASPTGVELYDFNESPTCRQLAGFILKSEILTSWSKKVCKRKSSVRCKRTPFIQTAAFWFGHCGAFKPWF